MFPMKFSKVWKTLQNLQFTIHLCRMSTEKGIPENKTAKILAKSRKLVIKFRLKLTIQKENNRKVRRSKKYI